MCPFFERLNYKKSRKAKIVCKGTYRKFVCLSDSNNEADEKYKKHCEGSYKECGNYIELIDLERGDVYVKTD